MNAVALFSCTLAPKQMTCLRNGAMPEVAQETAHDESGRAAGLHDGRNDQVSLDEVERIFI
jgi:hypothetical protein